jgi:hypothetical protein
LRQVRQLNLKTRELSTYAGAWIASDPSPEGHHPHETQFSGPIAVSIDSYGVA